MPLSSLWKLLPALIPQEVQVYAGWVISCAITDLGDHSIGFDFATDELLYAAQRWSVDGIELVQLREKHLAAGQLLALARKLVNVFAGSCTRLLVNSRADVALAAGAAGVHLPATPGGLTPSQVRQLFLDAGAGRPLVSVACHTGAEVRQAREHEADYVLFSPVFEKPLRSLGETLPGVGLAALRAAVEVAGPVPVLALGGITEVNAAQCLAAGARGVAGIRLFQPAAPARYRSSAGATPA